MPPVPCPPRPSPPLSAVVEKKSRSQKTIEAPPRGTSPPLGDEVQPLSERTAVASTLFHSKRLCVFIAKGGGRACENYRGVPEHETQGNRETKRSLEKGEVA